MPITLKQASQISGYSSDYIGSLVRKEKIWGRKVSSKLGSHWVTTAEEVLGYRDRKEKSRYREEEYISLKEAAQVSGYAPDYIGYLIRTRKIQGKKMSSEFGDYWVVSGEELARYQTERDGKEHKQKAPTGLTLPAPVQETRSVSPFKQSPGIWQNPLTLLTKKSFNFLQTLSFSLLLLVGLTAFTVVALSPNEQTIEIFPTVSKGEWNNPDQALQRELDNEASLAEFSLANSSSLDVQGLLPQPEPQGTATSSADGTEAAIPSLGEIESGEEEDTTEDDSSNGVEFVEPSESVAETIHEESATSTPEELPTPEPFEEPSSTPTSTPEVQPSPEEPTSQNLRQRLFSLFFSETGAQTESFNEASQSEELDLTETTSPQEDGVQELFLDDETTQDTATSSERELSSDFPEEEINTFTSPSEDGVEFIDIDIPSIDEDSSQEPSFTLFTSKQSVVYSGFTVPEGAGVLQRTAIGISLAFEGHEDNQDELLIDWSQDGEDWSNLVVLSQDTPYSNSINKDYLYIYLPGKTTWEDITNLQIRFTALSNQEEARSPIYLDSIWIEATHVGGKEKLPKVRIHDATEFVKAKKHFGAYEDILLVIEKPPYTKTELKQLILQSKAEMLEGRIEQLKDKESILDAIGNTFEGFLPFLGGDSNQEEQETIESVPEGDGSSLDVSGQEPTEEEPVQTEEVEQPQEESVEEPPFDNDQGKPTEESTTEESGSEAGGSQTSTEEALSEPSEPSIEESTEEPSESTESPTSELIRSLWGIQEAKAQKDPITLRILDSGGKEVSLSPQITSLIQNGRETLEIRISPSKRGFKPGKYTAHIELETDGVIITSDYDFTWGVLAINVNKSIYSPGEIAYVQLGMVNDSGSTICNARMDLIVIHKPTGSQANLSTEDGTIQYSDECAGNTFTSTPDYFGYVQLLDEPGTYEMTLTGTPFHGTPITITDQFEVRDTPLFDVERFGPTRIYPPAFYEVKFKITPTRDFRGRVIESVPDRFAISELDPSIQYSVFSIQGAKQIIWNVNWKAGQTYELGYKFLAPNISPYKWLLGPLSFEPGSIFQPTGTEARGGTVPPQAGRDLFSQAAANTIHFFKQLLDPPSLGEGRQAEPSAEDSLTDTATEQQDGVQPFLAGPTSDDSSTATSTNKTTEPLLNLVKQPELSTKTFLVDTAYFEEIRKWQIAADASEGPNFSSVSGDCTEVDNPGGTITVTNPGNAFSDNAVRATATVDGTETEYVRCINYGFNIPADATSIDGIIVTLDRQSASTQVEDGSVRLVDELRAICCDDKQTATGWTKDSDTNEDHGSSTDDWGPPAPWTPSEINDPDFGAVVAWEKVSANGPAREGRLDSIQITVHYTPFAVAPSNLETPTIAIYTDSPDPVAQLSAVSFDVGWEDADSATSWTEATSTAQWAARTKHTSVVFATSTTEYM